MKKNNDKNNSFSNEEIEVTEISTFDAKLTHYRPRKL